MLHMIKIKNKTQFRQEQVEYSIIYITIITYGIFLNIKITHKNFVF